MLRAPIIFALILLAAPVYAAPSEDQAKGWRVDAGGVVLGLAARAMNAIDLGDVAAMAEDVQGPSAAAPRSDPSRIGMVAMERNEQRKTGAIARVSARFTF